MRNTACSAILIAFGLWTTTQTGLGNDWPQWRGPNRDGVSAETGLLKKWPEGGPQLAWQVAGLGGGYAGVAVAAGRIYTMGEDKESSSVTALSETDGHKLWGTKVGKPGAPGWGGFSGPRSTPTVDGDRVYALGQYGELVCVEAATGREVWRKHLTADFGGALPEWGFSESVLIDGDKLLCTPGGKQGAIVALDKKTGQKLWATKDFTDDAQYSSLIAVEIDGVRQYIQRTMESLVGVAQDGRLLWRADCKGRTAVIPTPIYHDHHVFVTAGYDIGAHLFKVGKQGDTFQAEQVYAARELDNHHGGFIRLGEHLYGHTEKKGWVCVEMKTGRILWSERDKQKKGAIGAADGMLYLRRESDAGTVVMIAAKPDGFAEAGRFDQPERSGKNSWPHPVIANGKLYLRDQGALLCYSLKQ
jgi:outer membrane protein assembly factor BamB